MTLYMNLSQPIPNFTPFPADFIWGVAASSFQIEGAAKQGGRGPSIWDDFCKQPEAIADGSNGDVACDHYHLWESDLDIIFDLGLNAYRFSVAWSRVQPEGFGAWNEEGLAFYDRLIDGLIKRGIQPHLTLNHWDLPSGLQAKGGWKNRETVDHFVAYAKKIAARFGDRVISIATHNEPWVQTILGHETGIFAPGIKNRATAMQVSHHLLLSHGLALQALRAQGCKSQLGIVLNLAPMHPVSNSAADVAKAKIEDGRLLRWFMDPMFKACYPQDILEFLGDDAPKVQAGDMQTIATSMDFLGVNYYSRSLVSSDPDWSLKQTGCELTDMGWEVYPQGLTELLVRLNRDYKIPPISITENGAAFPDQMTHGRVHDRERTLYIANHIAAMQAAMKQGVVITSYMVWSLLDNFEWASGYAKRFGIVYVDYETQKRVLKDSALWYRDFVQSQKIIREVSSHLHDKSLLVK